MLQMKMEIWADVSVPSKSLQGSNSHDAWQGTGAPLRRPGGGASEHPAFQPEQQPVIACEDGFWLVFTTAS